MTERERVSTHAARQAESARAGRGLTMQGTQASSVTKATVKVIDFMQANKSIHRVNINSSLTVANNQLCN